MSSFSSRARGQRGRRGRLIVFEGISGSGKSQGIRLLQAHLQERGIQAEVLEWNANRRIRALVALLQQAGLLTPRLYSVLQWIGFWLDYVTRFRPLLRLDKVVIADRYAYTGLARDQANGAGWRRRSGGLLRLFRQPELLLFYDTPPEVCRLRIEARGKRLFHPDGRQLSDPGAYLGRMRGEYLRILSTLRMNGSVPVVRIRMKDEPGAMLGIVDDCLLTWYAASSRRAAEPRKLLSLRR